LTRLSASWNATEARLCEIGQGATASGGEPDVILREFGFLENGSLTEVGNDYYLARFVLDSDDEVAKVIGAHAKAAAVRERLLREALGQGRDPRSGRHQPAEADPSLD
jgi:hypothetical protein